MQMHCSTFSIVINATHATCTPIGFGWLPVTEQSKWEAVIHACTQRSKVTCIPLPDSSAFLFKIKKTWLGTFWSGHVYSYIVIIGSGCGQIPPCYSASVTFVLQFSTCQSICAHFAVRHYCSHAMLEVLNTFSPADI